MTTGRPPMPNELRVLNGGRSASPDRIRNHVVAQDRPVEKPAFVAVDRRTEEVWDRIVPRLKGMGHVKEIDEDALAVMCQSLAGYYQAIEHIREHGQIITSFTKHGDEVLRKNPAVTVAREELASFDRLAARFGLTPADRARITFPDRGDVGEGEDFFGSGS